MRVPGPSSATATRRANFALGVLDGSFFGLAIGLLLIGYLLLTIVEPEKF